MGKPIHSPPSAAPSSIPPARFKGVRQRSWGKWVSEIRMPHSRDRIWLGSFASPLQAARAYDAAALCLRGLSTSLNLPHLPTPPVPNCNSSTPSLSLPVLSKKDIQCIAAAAAADVNTFDADPAPHPSPSSVITTAVIDAFDADLPPYPSPPSVLTAVNTEKIVQQTSWIFSTNCPSQLQLQLQQELNIAASCNQQLQPEQQQEHDLRTSCDYFSHEVHIELEDFNLQHVLQPSTCSSS